MTQDTHWWLALFGDKIILAALVAMWGPPVFALFQLAKGQAWIGAAVFIGWFPVFWWVVRECNRRQLVRGWLAVASTMVVLALFAMIFWPIL